MHALSRFLAGLASVALLSFVAEAAPFAHIPNAYSDNVSVIDATTNTVIATVPAEPFAGGVAVDPDGTLVYVTSVDANSLSIIDVLSYSVIAEMPVGAAPVGVAVNRVGTLTLTFADGNAGGIAYSVTLPATAPVPQTKQVTPQVFRAPGTVCQ